ncbi:TetR/AcrR family transcriptional regulator [Frateuria aurantia]
MAPRPRLTPAASPTSGQRGRHSRTDGDLTRAEILEVAGQLYARKERTAVTAKAVCQQAGVNMAAINYHFGGRDGLYRAVLSEAHRRLMSLDFLYGLGRSELTLAEQLRCFLQALARRVLDDRGWAVKVWTRAVLSPSPALESALQQQSRPKFQALALIIAEIVGLAPTDPRIPELILSVIAPCVVMLMVGREAATPIQPLFAQSPTALADAWWHFAWAGLQAASTASRQAGVAGPSGVVR